MRQVPHPEGQGRVRCAHPGGACRVQGGYCGATSWPLEETRYWSRVCVVVRMRLGRSREQCSGGVKIVGTSDASEVVHSVW